MASDLQVHFLGELPLIPEVRAGGDSGSPVTLKGPGDANGQQFFKLAENVVERMQAVAAATRGPRISVMD